MSDSTADDHKFMRAAEPEPAHWWGRRLPSVVTLAVLLLVTSLTVWAMTRQATEVLPEVGKDRLGADNWSDPLGVELVSGFQVARVPDCAAGAFTRFVLWDPNSDPYWEVVGPPTPLSTLLIGVAPEGFTTLTPFSDPPPGEVLRLVGIRRDGGPVGVRFRVADLRTGRVVSGNPLVPFTVEGFQTAEVCGASADAVDGEDPSGDGVTEVDEGSTVGSDGGFTPSLGADGSGTRSTTTLDDGTAPLTGD